ncbi:unnamed protein product [Withania somnifera]
MKGGKGKGALRKETRSALKPVEDRKLGKRKATSKDDKRKVMKAKKEKKDPNKPKRPPSAFFVFLEEFRKTFKKENPNVKAVSAVGKAGGEKWKSMTAAEKAPYEAKAAKRNAEYGKLMNAYNKKQKGRLPCPHLIDGISCKARTTRVEKKKKKKKKKDQKLGYMMKMWRSAGRVKKRTMTRKRMKMIKAVVHGLHSSLGP